MKRLRGCFTHRLLYEWSVAVNNVVSCLVSVLHAIVSCYQARAVSSVTLLFVATFSFNSTVDGHVVSDKVYRHTCVLVTHI